MSDHPLLEVKDLSVAFRQGENVTLAVDRISFDVKKGETVALVGKSGSGKSATALSVLKLLPYPAASHPSGSVQFKGKELLSLSDRKMRQVRGNDITIIFQEPMTSLNPLHTIEKQIGEILELHQRRERRQGARAHYRIAQSGRHSRSGRAAQELSASIVRRSAPARDDRDGAWRTSPTC